MNKQALGTLGHFIRLDILRFAMLGMAVCCCVPAWSQPESGREPSDTIVQESRAGNSRVKEIFRSFQPLGAQRDESRPTPPGEMVSRLSARSDVEVDLVASEPDVSQPLFVTWDSRGRMWVVQYRQYQYPAGLKVVRFDQYLRAVFDKVPEPPPLGPVGEDRITVFEDTNGDGEYDTSKDVLAGLNIASSVQVGPRGIWVLNPPYLLRYPDADGDDIPDGDPEVHLSGFGLQDTHSVANSLTWGPDGWLYGANGSTTAGTVSSKVTKGIRFQGQCIWRYHPTSQVFEVFAEGGGNTFSLEIDSKGRVFSGTNGGKLRGFYYPQGSYAHKNWGKHGPLTNPYAMGYFQGMPLKSGDSRRFAQAFLIYEGGLFGKEFERTIVAPNSLHNLVWNSTLLPDGSNYQTVDLENLIESDDRWFRPVYSGVGPDGGIYIADWYDTRLSHVNPVDDWHKDSGRIYRVRPKGSSPTYEEGDLRSLSGEELITRFGHPNKWVRRRAMLELGWRGDTRLVETLAGNVERLGSLESLWAIHLMDQLTSKRASSWIDHESEHIRRWVVRLLGDRHEGHPAMVRLAKVENNVQVRSQLASTAKRIDASTGLSVLAQLVTSESDLEDPHLPLMYWWCLESHADDWEQVMAFLSVDGVWSRAMVQEHLLTRLMQRYASLGTADDLNRCNELVKMAPDDSSKEKLLVGLNNAFQGRSIPKLPLELEQALSNYQSLRGDSGAVLSLRRGSKGAIPQALKLLASSATDLGVRIEIVRTLGELHPDDAMSVMIRVATGRLGRQPALQRTAIHSLAGYDQDEVAIELVRSFYGTVSAEHGLRATACRTLASRVNWAPILLKEINEWRLKPAEVPSDVVAQLRSYDDPDIVAATLQAFGEVAEVTSVDKVAKINRLASVISSSVGDVEKGKAHFTRLCATCHKLFGEGKSVGPPLDGYERGKTKFWLNAIVAPSLEIREGYQTFKALTIDGRVISGVIIDQDPNTVSLRTADGQVSVLSRAKLERFEAVKTSLMPEDLLRGLADEAIRDLFAYLQLGTS